MAVGVTISRAEYVAALDLLALEFRRNGLYGDAARVERHAERLRPVWERRSKVSNVDESGFRAGEMNTMNAARESGVTRQAITKAIADGRLRARELPNGRYAITQDALAEFAARREARSRT